MFKKRGRDLSRGGTRDALGIEESNRPALRFISLQWMIPGAVQPFCHNTNKRRDVSIPGQQFFFQEWRRRGKIGWSCLFQASLPLPLSKGCAGQQGYLHSFLPSFIMVDISKRFVCDYLTSPVGKKKMKWLSACVWKCPLQTFLFFFAPH